VITTNDIIYCSILYRDRGVVQTSEDRLFSSLDAFEFMISFEETVHLDGQRYLNCTSTPVLISCST
jgi:hypothetical protein